MSVAALILLLVTVLAGTALLAEVAPVLAASRRVLVLVSVHITLGAAALVLWTVLLIGDNDGIAWVAFALLLAVAALGVTALLRTLRGGDEVPDGVRISPAVIAVHGAAAAITIVLVLVAALVR